MLGYWYPTHYNHCIMKCDRCGEEATVHDVKLVKGGIDSQIHLCEKCARSMGVIGKEFKSIDELLQDAGMQLLKEEAQATQSKCTQCGTTWATFRKRGHLGCPNCYDTFITKLGPIIEKTHEGGTHHVGKVPKYCLDDVDVNQQLQYLRKQLADSLAAEQYEKAAELRDTITNIGDEISQKNKQSSDNAADNKGEI